MTALGFEARLDAPLDAARARVTEALAAEGFGVLTEIDLRATMKKKLGVEMPPYLILGACNPEIAHRALAVDPDLGLLLPCNVVLRESDGGTLVSIADPQAMFRAAGTSGLEDLVRDAETRLRRVAAAIG